MTGGRPDEYWDAGADPGAPGDDATSQIPLTPAGAGPPRSTPPAVGRAGRRGGGRAVPVAVAVLAAAAVVLATVTGVVLAGGSTGAKVAGHRAPVTRARSSPTTTLSPAALLAARTLDNLLVQNQQNRGAVQGAAEQIGSCGDVSGAVNGLEQRAASRQALLGELTQLDLGALPGGAALVADLRVAWQQSMVSDRAYARWGQDEVGSCTPDDHADANFRVAQQSDLEATSAKQAFVAQWDRSAVPYGLQPWQADQL